MLYDLFYFRLKPRKIIKRIHPLTLGEFKNFLKSNIVGLNLNNIEFVSRIYSKYLNLFTDFLNNKLVIRNLKFNKAFNLECRSTTLKYYLDRGWDLSIAKDKLRNRQATEDVNLKVSSGKMTLDEAKRLSLDKAKRRSNTIRNKENYKEICFNRGNSNRFKFYLDKINPLTGNLFTETEAREKIKLKNSVGFNNFWNDVRSGNKLFVGNTTLDYYLLKGLSEHDAKIALKTRQTTRSLDSFIHRYGKEDGLKRFKSCNEKWLKTLNEKTDEEKIEILKKKLNRLKFYSEWAIKLIENFNSSLLKIFPNTKHIFYGDSEYFIYDHESRKIKFFDLTILDLNLIIEFNGSHVHPNKKLLTKDQWEKWINPYTRLKADETYKRDQDKIALAKNKGFDIFEIWDTDDFETQMHEILDFLKDKYV
jgi:hypothetical protein